MHRAGLVSFIALAMAACARPDSGTSQPSPAAVDAATLAQEARRMRDEGRRREAIELWSRALQESPDDHAIRLELAGALIGEHRVLAARDHLDLLRERTPNEARVWLEWGRLHVHLDEPHDALEAFERAVALDPDLISAQLGRIEVLVGLGRCDEARASMRALGKRGYLRAPRLSGALQRCQHRPADDAAC